MKLEEYAKRLEALGNPTRLSIFRILVQAGTTGVAVGSIQKALSIPPSTLSHHIAKLVQVGLMTQVRDSRTLFCLANYQAMDDLIGFLQSDCCAGNTAPNDIN